MTFTALLTLFGGAFAFAAAVAALAVARQRWKVRRCVALLETSTEGAAPLPVFPVLFAMPGRRGAGAMVLRHRVLVLEPVDGQPLEVRLREVRSLTSRLRSRHLARYQKAAPTFHLDLRGDLWLDLVIQSGDQAALDRLRRVLEDPKRADELWEDVNGPLAP